MTHPDPKAALEEILERHKEMEVTDQLDRHDGPCCTECSHSDDWPHWVALARAAQDLEPK